MVMASHGPCGDSRRPARFERDLGTPGAARPPRVRRPACAASTSTPSPSGRARRRASRIGNRPCPQPTSRTRPAAGTCASSAANGQVRQRTQTCSRSPRGAAVVGGQRSTRRWRSSTFTTGGSGRRRCRAGSRARSTAARDVGSAQGRELARSHAVVPLGSGRGRHRRPRRGARPARPMHAPVRPRRAMASMQAVDGSGCPASSRPVAVAGQSEARARGAGARGARPRRRDHQPRPAIARPSRMMRIADARLRPARGRARPVPIDGHRWTCWWVSTWVTAEPGAARGARSGR